MVNTLEEEGATHRFQFERIMDKLPVAGVAALSIDAASWLDVDPFNQQQVLGPAGVALRKAGGEIVARSQHRK